MYSSTLPSTSALDGGWVVNATPRPLYPRYPLYRRLSGPQSLSVRVWKISPPPGFDPRTVQPVASRYTDWTIPAPGRLNQPKCPHPVNFNILLPSQAASILVKSHTESDVSTVLFPAIHNFLLCARAWFSSTFHSLQLPYLHQMCTHQTKQYVCLTARWKWLNFSNFARSVRCE